MTSTEPFRVVCVVGARPNFMKIAPIMRALGRGADISPVLVHTGQHYDESMKEAFFQQLGIPRPDVDLEVGSGSHAVQTAEIMKRFEPVLDREECAAVLVVGDVNSTIACALVAAKKGVPVVHVEAGLRSNDRTMPEEINRVLTDQISDLLFTTERHAALNLAREGIPEARVRFVGNVMIDTLLANREKCPESGAVLAGLPGGGRCLGPQGYGVVTLHRPSNVDDPSVLRSLVDSLARVAERIPLVFPLHPRTAAKLESANLMGALSQAVTVCPPLPYLELLSLMGDARLVLTDSGGLQEETTALGVPCLTLRENTERPITVEEGTNTIVGSNPDLILACVDDVLAHGGKRGRIPELWDGHTADRIRDHLLEWLRGMAGASHLSGRASAG